MPPGLARHTLAHIAVVVRITNSVTVLIQGSWQNLASLLIPWSATRILNAHNHRRPADATQSDPRKQMPGWPVIGPPAFGAANICLEPFPLNRFNESRPYRVTNDLTLVLPLSGIRRHGQHLFDRSRRPTMIPSMLLTDRTPRRDPALIEVFGNSIKRIAGHDPSGCLLHNRTLERVNLNAQKSAGLGILDAPITVNLLAVRSTLCGVVPHASENTLAGLGALIFRIHSIFQQGSSIPGICRVIQATMRRHPNTDTTQLTELDEIDPFAGPTRPPTGLPQPENICAKKIQLQITHQLRKPFTGLPRISAGTSIHIPVRLRMQTPPFLLHSQGRLGVLLLWAPSISSFVFRHP
ncbi:hypothetical protein ANMWB30_25000 [Arthrobacter sp. MWB30]|nr:hypothetical protein ANMWB30_25000 [Arthrobacter sp. MWB30]